MLPIVESCLTYCMSRSFTFVTSSTIGGTTSQKPPHSTAPTTTKVARMAGTLYFRWQRYWKNFTIGKSM